MKLWRPAATAWLLVVLSGGAGFADPPPPSVGADPEEFDPDTPAEVAAKIPEAIARGVAWLKKRPDPSGWYGNEAEKGISYNGTTEIYKGPFGPTALAVYALLKCGVPADDGLVRRSLDYLRRHDRTGGDAYEISMKLLAVTATADPFKRTKNAVAAGDRVRLVGPDRKWAEEMLRALAALRAPDGWRYWGKNDDTEGGRQDMSSTQLAALALLAAERCGLKVDPDLWAGVLRFALTQQEESGPAHPRAVLVHASAGSSPGVPAKAPTPAKPKPGEAGGGTVAPPPPPNGAPGGVSANDRARGFAYARRTSKAAHEQAASGGMTACGVGSLMMARYSLVTRSPKTWASENAAAVQQAVYDGLAWLDKNWSPFENPIEGASQYHLYYVYCVERAMDLVGASRLGQHFWYAEMAAEVLAKQKPDGTFDDGAPDDPSSDPIFDTCFALLFLHRATKGGIPFPSVTGGSDDPPTDGR